MADDNNILPIRVAAGIGLTCSGMSDALIVRLLLMPPVLVFDRVAYSFVTELDFVAELAERFAETRAGFA